MTTDGPTMLSLAASGVYVVVVIICAAAASAALRYRQEPGHWRTWLIVGGFFVLLIVLRLVDAEDFAREYLRSAMRDAGGYNDRRSVQGPIVAAIIAIVGAVSFALIYRAAKLVRGRRNIARMVGMAAMLSMIFLMGLRLASLHMTDALLYGPLKLNWVVDLGAALCVMAAGIYYIQLVRQQP